MKVSAAYAGLYWNRPWNKVNLLRAGRTNCRREQKTQRMNEMSKIPCPLVNLIYHHTCGGRGRTQEDANCFQGNIDAAARRCTEGTWPLWHNGVYYYKGMWEGAPTLDRESFEFGRTFKYKTGPAK